MASNKINIEKNQLTVPSLTDELSILSFISGACNSGFKSIIIGVNESGKVLGVNPVGFTAFLTEKINSTFGNLIEFSIELHNHDFKQYAVLRIENVKTKPIGFINKGNVYEKMIVSGSILPLNHLLKTFLISEQKENLPLVSDDIFSPLDNLPSGKYTYSRFRRILKDFSISDVDDLIVFMLRKGTASLDFENNQTFILIL